MVVCKADDLPTKADAFLLPDLRVETNQKLTPSLILAASNCSRGTSAQIDKSYQMTLTEQANT